MASTPTLPSAPPASTGLAIFRVIGKLLRLNIHSIYLQEPTPKTEKAIYWDGEIIWITPADYKTDDHYISKGRKNITKEGLASCATEIVPINSLIFSKRAPIGTVSLAKTPLCTNQGCISCVPKSATNSNFFYYSCRIATKEFEMLGSGATFLEISSSNFANFKMPLPPLTEQQAIADYLDKKCAEIDGLKAKLSKKRETLKEPASIHNL